MVGIPAGRSRLAGKPIPGIEGITRWKASDASPPCVESSVVEFRVPPFGPLGSAGIGGAVDGLAEVAEMLLGVEPIDDLDRAGEQFVGDVPNPGRAIP